MIINSENLQTFINQCANDSIEQIILNYCRRNHIGGDSPSEITSWKNSLPILAKVLDILDIDHTLNVAVEYKLEPTNNRIDFLIAGNNDQNKETVIIIELKQWSNIQRSNLENRLYANVGNAHSDDAPHPSLQSFNYATILKNFYEYVYKNNVNVKSCSYLFKLDNSYDVIATDKNKFLFLNDSPIFLRDDY